MKLYWYKILLIMKLFLLDDTMKIMLNVKVQNQEMTKE